VTLTNSTTFPNTDYALQVVEFAGATVTRGSMTNVLGATDSAVDGSYNSTNYSPLFSARSELLGTANACKFRLRGYVSNGTGNPFRVRRGTNVDTMGTPPTPFETCANAPVAEVAWEVIQWPSNVALQRRSTEISIALNASSATWALGASPAAHRTLVYLPGQGASGQASGETERYDGNEAGTGLATLGLSGTTVTVTHAALGSGAGNALFTPYAVTFDP
jgi:hypothetical protein